ncbi:MAG: ferrous iron transport protein B [Clostridiales bacterium]|nr:ferrous iron transport protein B [Clostridiales bacterium]
MTSVDNNVVALVGNPNTGKSTLFNALTGLNQHTGNWPGKTVTSAFGRYMHNGKSFFLVDLPGSYSLLANSPEEEVARDFICFGRPRVAVIVADATCLERNLNLILQVLEMIPQAVVCVNLMDEARRNHISVRLDKLSQILGVPVVGTSASSGQGLTELKQAVDDLVCGRLIPEPIRIQYDSAIEEAIAIVEPAIKIMMGRSIDSRWLALRILEGDDTIIAALRKFTSLDVMGSEEIRDRVEQAKKKLAQQQIFENDLRDRIVFTIVNSAERISREVWQHNGDWRKRADRKIDEVLTSRLFGIPAMLLLLGAALWISIVGANYPSKMLANIFFWLEKRLSALFILAGAPDWLRGALVEGLYRTLAWVVSVMLPPMAIFFPMFTLLEDLGYLPRVAFNLDYYFKKARAHGKQALTMCMGLGCNAVGVTACRIIDSPRERLIGIITNNYMPCNGRFPTLIALSAVFVAGRAGGMQPILAAVTVLGLIVFSIVVTLVASKILSCTILKGLPSSFALELPPYRKPQIGRILIRSLLDRSLFVLLRAVTVAAPAGLIIWFMANVSIFHTTLLNHCAGFLDPFARLMGLDGYILLAFLLGFPANEIVIPVVIMSYMSGGAIIELDSLQALRWLLEGHGWTWVTALCTMLFSLNHFPCGTTLLTIHKETGSWKWTLISFIVPTITGIVVCSVVVQAARLLRLV